MSDDPSTLRKPLGQGSATGGLVPPRRIAVNGRSIRLRWLQQIIWAFLAANVGALIISALYYLFIQVRWHVGGHTYLYLKPNWDGLFHFKGWPQDRHDIRDVYEAVLATLFVRSLLANWRKHDRRAPSWYVVISPFLIVVVAFPVVAAGVWLIDHGLPYLWHAWLAHRTLHNPAHLPRRLDWLGTYLAGYPWQAVLIGILAGLVVHRVYAPAGNTVQLYFIGRSVDRTRDAIAAGEENPVPAPAPLAVAAGDQGTGRLDHAEPPARPGPDPRHQGRGPGPDGRPGRPGHLRRIRPLRGGQGPRITRERPCGGGGRRSAPSSPARTRVRPHGGRVGVQCLLARGEGVEQRASLHSARADPTSPFGMPAVAPTATYVDGTHRRRNGGAPKPDTQ